MSYSKLLHSTLFAVFLCAIPLFCRIFAAPSPSTHPESNCFIMHYNSDAPVIKLIFDPLRTDWANFQARELSYILDYADAKFIFHCVKAHHAHFFSLSAILLLLASAALIHKELKKLYPEAHWGILLLPPLMYVCAFMGNIGFFRSSKPAVSFLLVGVFFTLAGILKTPEKYRSIFSLLPGIIFLHLLPGFDRIGFFIAAVCAAGGAFLLMILSLKRFSQANLNCTMLKKPLIILSLAALSSAILSLIYNFVIAPKIVMALNNYHISFNFQTFQTPSESFVEGLKFVLQNYGGFFLPTSSLSALIFGIFVTLSLGWITKRLADQNPEKIVLPLAFAGIFIVSVFCSGMMIARHPMIIALPLGNYFQVLGTALIGIFAITLMEVTDQKIRQLMIIFAVAACLTPLLRSTVPYLQEKELHNLHKKSTAYTIELLNNPEMKQEKVLPSSSRELIKFFRGN